MVLPIAHRMGTSHQMPEFKSFTDYFTFGLSFEQAKESAGFANCSPAIALLLAKYWRLLEMEAAFNCDKHFDQMFAEGL